ncbi:MAG TPA: F-box protein [Rhabdochlamydiaceae bacterium]|nr:F-box protein [Rhabdochlamydiaceae bacterium]
MSQITRLPDDLIGSSFLYLSLPDLIICSNVCSKWRCLTNEDYQFGLRLQQVFKQCRLLDTTAGHDEVLTTLVTAMGGSRHDLIFQNLLREYDEKLMSIPNREIKSHFKNLTVSSQKELFQRAKQFASSISVDTEIGLFQCYFLYNPNYTFKFALGKQGTVVSKTEICFFSKALRVVRPLTENHQREFLLCSSGCVSIETGSYRLEMVLPPDKMITTQRSREPYNVLASNIEKVLDACIGHLTYGERRRQFLMRLIQVVAVALLAIVVFRCYPYSISEK